MCETLRCNRFAWLAIGIVGGLVVGGLWPECPLHAVATDRCQTYAMATGALDENVEAVYFLDFLTGDLRGWALSRTAGQFTAFFGTNVLKTLGADPAKNPSYMLATGIANIRRRGSVQQPSMAVVYVGEVTSGNVAAYAVPWNPAVHAMGRPIQEELRLLDVKPFRAAAMGTAVPGP